MQTSRADKGKAAVPGLQVRTLATGETNYRLRWRIAGGEQRSLVFKADDLRKARSHARALLETVEAGHDPRPGKRRVGVLTLRGGIAAWIRANRRRWRRGTIVEYTGILRRRVLPALDPRPKHPAKHSHPRTLRSIQRPEIRALLAGIVAKGHAVEANRTFAILRAFFRWTTAVNQEHLGVTVDATAGLTRPGGRERPRDVVLSDDELRRLLAAGDPFLTFLAHTGVREQEGRSLTWQDVDLDAGTWRISATAAKSGVARVVPLTAPVVELLKAQRAKYAERPWRKSRDQKAYAELSRKLGFPVRPHDLRRTLGQYVKDTRGPGAMHATLGHAELTLTRTYGPAPSTETVRGILTEWSARLDQLVKQV
jgi:integrase